MTTKTKTDKASIVAKLEKLVYMYKQGKCMFREGGGEFVLSGHKFYILKVKFRDIKKSHHVYKHTHTYSA